MAAGLYLCQITDIIRLCDITVCNFDCISIDNFFRCHVVQNIEPFNGWAKNRFPLSRKEISLSLALEPQNFKLQCPDNGPHMLTETCSELLNFNAICAKRWAAFRTIIDRINCCFENEVSFHFLWSQVGLSPRLETFQSQGDCLCQRGENVARQCHNTTHVILSMEAFKGKNVGVYQSGGSYRSKLLFSISKSSNSFYSPTVTLIKNSRFHMNASGGLELTSKIMLSLLLLLLNLDNNGDINVYCISDNTRHITHRNSMLI